MRITLMYFAAFALLAIAIAASLRVLDNAPSFNSSLRMESVFGDWRVPIRSSIYDKSEYRYQIGYGYLQGDAAALLFGDGALPEPEEQQANIAIALRVLDASLDDAPGRLGAWTALAWARLLSGDPEGAKHALAVSWGMAPFNIAEAAERLSLAEALGSRGGWLQNPEVAISVSNDLKTLKKFDERYLDLFLDEFPQFESFGSASGG